MLRPPPRSTRTDTLVPYTTLFRSRQEAIAGVDRVRAGASSGFEDEVGTQVGLRGAVAPQAYGGVCLLHERHLGVGVGVDDDGLDAEVAAGAQDAAGDLATVGDEQSRDHSRNTPKFISPSMGWLLMTDRQMPRTVRVSRGSRTPSS